MGDRTSQQDQVPLRSGILLWVVLGRGQEDSEWAHQI